MKNSNSKYKQIYKIVNGDEITIFFYNENISSIDEFFVTLHGASPVASA